MRGLCFRVGASRLANTDFTTTPVVAAWIEDFRALNTSFPVVDKQGLGNWGKSKIFPVIQAAINQYETAVKNYLTYGLPLKKKHQTKRRSPFCLYGSFFLRGTCTSVP